MLSLGPFAFAAPWLLAALVVLPAIWWLLRLTPPAPRRIAFPPLRLLLGLAPKEETPHRTPWWLILLRLAIAALVIVALAQPLLRASDVLVGDGPIVVVVDNGWASGAHWERRSDALDDILDRAARAERPLLIVASADLAIPGAAPPSLLPEAEARRLAAGIEPRPWPNDPAATLAALEAAAPPTPLTAIWLTDGLKQGDGSGQAALAQWLQGQGELIVRAEGAGERAPLVLAPLHESGKLALRVARANEGAEETVFLRALDEDGGFVARQEARFAADATVAEVALDVPNELRNRIGRIAIENEIGAGSVYLLDESWRRRPVGLVSGGQEGTRETLLGDLFYIQRALEPTAELREGTVDELLERELAVMILADVGALGDGQRQALREWIDRGGVLVRFAGPRLAQNADDLLPVRVRAGDRLLGGALSWEQPATIAPFPNESPFAGLAIPPDVSVARQVLAEPDLDLGRKIWARLADGTPLVTGERSGDGWIVLVHTTANADWSNLALSGLFVEMLDRLVALSQGIVAAEPDQPLPPIATLDGTGQLGAPPPQAGPLAAAGETPVPGATLPPGYYGYEAARRAFNLADGIAPPEPLDALPAGIAAEPYATTPETALGPWLLGAALLLLALDAVVALLLRGLLLPTRSAARAAAVGLAIGMFGAAGSATAQDEAAAASAMSDEAIIAAIEVPRLAYVETGDREVDETTHAGLQGLTLILHQRTAAELGTPVAVDLSTDELAFYPILYWPVTQNQAPLDETGRKRVNEYMRNGGLIVFDMRDPGVSGIGAGALQQMTAGLDIPPLIPVPPEHVLSRTFYLLRDFPGRWAGGAVWIEQGEGRINDGVSSVIVGSNDWAAAWAIDELGRPIYPVVPGGDRQREYAYRFGVNLAMYALTGNYKSDQVHVPAILERLGQ